MLDAIAIVLMVFWFLGMVTTTAVGGLVHVLLVSAVVVVLIRVLSARV